MIISAHITPRTRFAFLHIPKTAGSTVLTFFADAFGKDAVWIHGENFDLGKLTRDIPDHIRAIGGHFQISEIDYLLPGDFHYVSIVRNPADRIVSYHQHVIAQLGHILQPDLPFREINADLAASSAFRTHNLNQQVQFLSRDWTAHSVQQLCERGMLSIATINEVDSFLRELAMRVGVPYREPQRLNVGSMAKPTLTTTVLRIVDEITIEDRALYDYVHQTEGQIRIVGDPSIAQDTIPNKMNRDELKERIASLPWHHQIDLGDGLLTPGKTKIDVLKAQAEIYFRENVRGKTVIDIGCWDGFNSFEAYRRGAYRVLATDHFAWSPACWGKRESFELARARVAPGVEVLDIDIPDLTLESVGSFDIALFCGVFYHLRHPLHLLERIAKLVKETLIVETHMDALDEIRPAMIFYPKGELANDPTNWWGPNKACVTAMLQDVGFSRVEFTPHPMYASRGIFHAHRS